MRRGLNFLSLAVFLFASAGVAGVAHAEMVQYMSRHPLPKRIGHGFCDIDVPHFHDYPPSDPRLYRQVNGQNYFVGDPTPYGYEGPRYSFYGPHPIADASVQLRRADATATSTGRITTGTRHRPTRTSR